MVPSQNPLFHLAIPVHDLGAAEAFYGEVLGCPRGRSADTWIDFNFFGHQLVVHLSPEDCTPVRTNHVDGEDVPASHFGAVLSYADWELTAARLQKAGASFKIEPTLRHRGEPGEQHIFFVEDPSGNALEFKSMTHPENLFAT